MELKALRALVKVAELGNISQAALALGLTQSTLSRTIAGLEREFGGQLFHRTGRGVALTETGEIAVPRARAIVVNSDQLMTDVRDFGQSPSGVVTLAFLPSLMRGTAGDLFERVRALHPAITLRILEGFSGQIDQWLADGRADIGILSRYRKRPAHEEKVLSSSRLMLVGAPDGRRERATIRFRDMARMPLVLPVSLNGMRMTLDEHARRHRVKLQVVAEADSLEAQKAMVRREGCYAVLGLATVAPEVASGQLQARRIVEPELPRLIVMSTTPHRPLSRAARHVTAIVRGLDLEG
jgi:LysR family nitrogen assimilation transcriptional regulator